MVCSGRKGSNEDLLLALDLVRDKGVISIVGAPDLNLPRAPFFAREARLVIARAAGVGHPGREVDVAADHVIRGTLFRSHVSHYNNARIHTYTHC